MPCQAWGRLRFLLPVGRVGRRPPWPRPRPCWPSQPTPAPCPAETMSVQPSLHLWRSPSLQVSCVSLCVCLCLPVCLSMCLSVCTYLYAAAKAPPPHPSWPAEACTLSFFINPRMRQFVMAMQPCSDMVRCTEPLSADLMLHACLLCRKCLLAGPTYTIARTGCSSK